MIAATLANIHRDPKQTAYAPSDFMPFSPLGKNDDADPPTQQQLDAERAAVFKRLSGGR